MPGGLKFDIWPCVCIMGGVSYHQGDVIHGRTCGSPPPPFPKGPGTKRHVPGSVTHVCVTHSISSYLMETHHVGSDATKTFYMISFTK